MDQSSHSPVHSDGNSQLEPMEPENEPVGPQEASLSGSPRLSIRQKSSTVNVEGDEEKKGKRGIVNGTKVSNEVHGKRKGKKIKLTFHQFNIPDSRDDSSLIVHEIGSVVRNEVPMVAATYGELPKEAYDIVLNHLDVHFEIDLDDTKLWNYFTLKATERFKDRKWQCKQHYLKHGANTPIEFEDREDQWKWLVAHFQQSNYNVC